MEAIPIDDIILYLSRSRRKIREFAVSAGGTSFVAIDLTSLAEHLFTIRDFIVSMAYQPEPYSCLWCVRNDGTMLGLSYQRLENVVSWHRHITDGRFERVAYSRRAFVYN